jgi:hypothetical protein
MSETSPIPVKSLDLREGRKNVQKGSSEHCGAVVLGGFSLCFGLISRKEV